MEDFCIPNQANKIKNSLSIRKSQQLLNVKQKTEGKESCIDELGK